MTGIPQGKTVMEIWNFYSKINFKIQTCLFTQHDSLQANLFEYIPKFIKKTPHHSLVVGASPKWGSPMRVGEREPALRSIISNKI